MVLIGSYAAESKTSNRRAFLGQIGPLIRRGRSRFIIEAIDIKGLTTLSKGLRRCSS